jgi:HTH-type transcriptional regulator / antitoxin HigA
MTITKLIRTKEEYENAIQRMEEIFDAKNDTPEGDELDLLLLVISDYEDKHYQIEEPDPIEAIKFRMEQEGLSQTDLAKVIGYKSRVSEILSRKRKLNLDMIRKLSEALSIPTEVLVTDYDLG